MSCPILDTVEAFRQKWDHLPEMARIVNPLPKESLLKTYAGFINEELQEMQDALSLPSPEREIEFGDGLCDALVFLSILVSRSGYQYLLPYLYREIARSNITKGSGRDLFDASGKMIKGPDYLRPQLKKYWTNMVTLSKDTPDEVIQYVRTRMCYTATDNPEVLIHVMEYGVFIRLAVQFPDIDLEPFVTFPVENAGPKRVP